METMQQVRFEVVKTEEQFKRLEEFAASFDHRINTRRYPITMLKIGNKPFAYFAVSFDPLASFGFHTDPKICSPRNTCDAIKAVSAWARLQYGGGFVMTPTDATRFTDEILVKLGLSDTKTRIFELLP